MAIEVIVWTCVAVFVATAVITLLGITNKIIIDKTYLNALFTALILEIVAIGMVGFTTNMKRNASATFVRVTFPISDISVGTQSQLFIAGVAGVNDQQALNCDVASAQDTVRYRGVTPSSKGFFNLTYDLSGRSLPHAVRASCRVLEGNTVVAVDTAQFTLSR